MWSGGPYWAEVLPSCRTASCWQGRVVRWRAPRRPPPSWQCPPPASTAGRTSVFPDTRRRTSATSLVTTSNSTGELRYLLFIWSRYQLLKYSISMQGAFSMCCALVLPQFWKSRICRCVKPAKHICICKHICLCAKPANYLGAVYLCSYS